MKVSDRRAFLKTAGQLGLGVGLVGAVATQPITCEQGQLPEDQNQTPTDTQLPQLPALPWTYAKLDVEEIRKKGHFHYFEKHCASGSFTAIVSTLVEEVGYPFTQIPTDMFIYGAGGVVGFSSLCGALNGAAAAINLVSDEPTTKKLVAELLSWYAATPLPTDISNTYAQNHEYLVEEILSDEVLPKSVSGGNLCHTSVTNWCLESGYASGSPERSERCGRLTGDVAAKAVELLNAEFDGTFESVNALPAAASGCRDCHSKGTDYDAGQFTRGKMDCNVCHVEPALSPHQ